MKALLRGMIGGFCWGGAPRPSGAGSTRQPDGCGVVGGCLRGRDLLGGLIGRRVGRQAPNVLGATLRATA